MSAHRLTAEGSCTCGFSSHKVRSVRIHITKATAKKEAAMAGRPSLTGRDEVSPVIQVRVRPEIPDALKARAEAEEKSPAAVHRDALEAYLSEYLA